MNKLRTFSRHQIKEICEEYAYSYMTRSDFCEKYFISSTTFYNILNKAVIEHIVSYKTATKMKSKALYNKQLRLNSKKGVEETVNHYYELFEKRKSFVFNRKRRIRLLMDFANRDLKESKSAFCKANIIDIELLEKILVFSVVNNELPKKVYLKIKENSLISISDESKVNNFFDTLETLQKEVKSGKKYDDADMLYKKVYRLLNSQSEDLNKNNNDSKPIKHLNEDGNFNDDGYAILDED